jgi:hypothetical protein
MKARVRVIEAVFVLILFGSQFESKAFNKDNASTKAKTIALVNGKEKVFEQYIIEQYTPFTEQEEWNVFMEVVTLYNDSPSKLTQIDTEARNRFNGAVNLLAHAMKQSTDAEAKAWFESLQKTSQNINFLWNVNWGKLLPSQEADKIVGEPIGQLNGF